MGSATHNAHVKEYRVNYSSTTSSWKTVVDAEFQLHVINSTSFNILNQNGLGFFVQFYFRHDTHTSTNTIKRITIVWVFVSALFFNTIFIDKHNVNGKSRLHFLSSYM